MHFTESNWDFFMNLLNREIALLALNKRVCWSRSIFTNVDDWIDFKGELKNYHVKFYTQVKAREREKLKISESNNNSNENVETDENDE